MCRGSQRIYRYIREQLLNRGYDRASTCGLETILMLYLDIGPIGVAQLAIFFGEDGSKVSLRSVRFSDFAPEISPQIP